MQEADPVLQNRYRIKGVLGRGGMGAVFQALDLSLEIPCVVKELLPPDDKSLIPDVTAQFRREAKILAGLRHPNLPRVSNYFTERGNYYLVMDLIEGQSLDKLVGENGLPERLVLDYADQLLGVLEYVHSKGLLHRDIKPANIIVQPDGHIVLVDFGLVKVMSNDQKTTTSLRGLSPRYAPPEQYTGGTDQRSDLYAVGATLYQVLTGRPPISALDQMAGEKLPSIREQHKSISPNTEKVVMKALSLDRNQRYSDAAEMRRDLLGRGGERKQVTREAPAPAPAQPARHPRLAGGWILLPGVALFLMIGFAALSLSGLLRPYATASQADVTAFMTVTLPSTAPVAPTAPTAPSPVVSTNVAAHTALTVSTTPSVGLAPTLAMPNATDTLVAPTSTLMPVAPTITAAAQTDTPAPPPQVSPLILTLAQGVTMTLDYVPAGNFLMGSDPSKDPNALPDELPQHLVNLSGFYIGQTEVTNAQYGVFARATKRQWDMPPGREDYPVSGVSWADGDAFSKWLTLVTGKKAHLPTEAQWEKACRGTDARIYPWGDTKDLTKLNSGEGGANDTAPVGKFYSPGDSPYGAEDMAGNVWEWISDWYSDTVYTTTVMSGVVPTDPIGPPNGTVHVKRGGSYGNTVVYGRCAYRYRNHPFSGSNSNGFRVAVSTN